jgi:hypothetical protein
MIALSPLMLEFLRRRGGTLILAALSLCGFLYGMSHPWTFSVAVHDKFPPILWQAMFISGLIFANSFKRYDALQLRWKMLTAAAAWTVFGLLFVSEFSSDFGLPHLNLHLSFLKIPLSDGEALRYLSMIVGIVVTTDMLWRRFLIASPLAEFVQTLGRKSLAVYVCHLWVVEGTALLASYLWWMGAWQIIMAVAAVLVLWLFALILDLRSSPRQTRQRPFLVAEMAQN